VTRSRVRSWLPVGLMVLGAAAFLVYGSAKGSESGLRLSPKVDTKLSSGYVVRIADGDTLTLADDRKIRLVQIDAPELAEGECYAQEARSALEKLAPIGAQVAPVLDPKLDIRDKNGRLLAYVMNSGTNVNLRLVEQGAAAPYFYQGERGRFADELMAAAHRARARKAGLWGACPDAKLEPGRQVDSGRP
jgi:endonuclease YncB( thermonuclease family)